MPCHGNGGKIGKPCPQVEGQFFNNVMAIELVVYSLSSQKRYLGTQVICRAKGNAKHQKQKIYGPWAWKGIDSVLREWWSEIDIEWTQICVIKLAIYTLGFIWIPGFFMGKERSVNGDQGPFRMSVKTQVQLDDLWLSMSFLRHNVIEIVGNQRASYYRY